MADPKDDVERIKETDVVFECPYCQKSMAIDYRAAGLAVPCCDCGKLVTVPAPGGETPALAEGAELDSELTARDALAECYRRLGVLEAAVEEHQIGRRLVEARDARLQHRLDQISTELEAVGSALDRIAVSLKIVAQTLKPDREP